MRREQNWPYRMKIPRFSYEQGPCTMACNVRLRILMSTVPVMHHGRTCTRTHVTLYACTSVPSTRTSTVLWQALIHWVHYPSSLPQIFPGYPTVLNCRYPTVATSDYLPTSASSFPKFSPVQPRTISSHPSSSSARRSCAHHRRSILPGSCSRDSHQRLLAADVHPFATLVMFSSRASLSPSTHAPKLGGGSGALVRRQPDERQPIVTAVHRCAAASLCVNA